MKKHDKVRIFLNILGICSIIGFFILSTHSFLIGISTFSIVIIIIYGKLVSKIRLNLWIDKYQLNKRVRIKCDRTSNKFPGILIGRAKSPLSEVPEVDVIIFKEALEDYEKSIWRSVSFTEKAQSAYDLLLGRFEKQQQTMKEENERKLAREKENLETERFNQKIEEYRLLEDGKVITTFFKNDGFIVDDIRNVSGNQYLVYANLSRYEVELKKGKVIYINKLKK
ncbi:hypothetical protein ARW15_14210 [Listeria monocytogenes]|uniref:hypothetical protein n=1 Tax=Listeria monocytogenes TaxID=1639 RepID=UPI0010B54B93|nr:hypothetical protein [Listeria monocytogenes]EAD4839147.1 hypothetical protein [Listeria monocytogenes]EAD4868864.1 hypothetical protein [Listeria monocytogenes]EAE1330974.1 hypothetical protein [Listeria monocytogenes]EAE9169128.1 hypothetical protein [Listeria monocytogenes]EAF9608927.1 hypothetical protein [Listeria monocytogenes]